LLAGADEGYQISRSLRFNSADSAYLNRTPGSAGNRKTWTWSGWVKRGISGTTQPFLGYGISGVLDYFGFDTSNQLYYFSVDSSGFTTRANYNTPAVFRDFSSWYHIVFSVDTTQATAANRLKVYVNGIQQTLTATVSFVQNWDTYINNNVQTNIGFTFDGGNRYFSGYLTEINFIDGSALTPSSFGETDAETGVWKPKKYAGTYGTNGFYLNFSDNSGTTSTTLGKDYSGNANNWTPNNFSVTAGAGNDSLVDTPTQYGTDTGAGGEVRGNYVTMNPIGNANGTIVTYSNGNLDFSHSASAGNEAKMTVIGTLGMTSGKWYWEYIVGGTVNDQLGITTMPATGSAFGSYCSYENGGTFTGSFTNPASGASYTTNDVIGMAYDQSAGTLAYYKNNALQGTITNISTTATFFALRGTNSSATGGAGTFNFGQRPFAYTAPSGFKALCTTNLPTPTIGATSSTQAGKYFDATTYTGTGSSRSVTNAGGFQPDLVWIKSRSDAYFHQLYDSLRGVNQAVYSNATNAETTEANGLSAFNSNGFQVGTGVGVNENTKSYVAWNWKANGAGSSNTSGTISSTVSANTTAGFSIVTYTGTGANATVGHGLGVAPKMVIVKNRSSAVNWVVGHQNMWPTTPWQYYLIFTTAGTAGPASTIWNNTAPTSTVFSIGTDSGVNTNTSNYVAYCFSEVAGYSAFGSYTGNGSTDGPFVYTGFRPRYVLTKLSSSSGAGWWITDTARDPYNATNDLLQANLANASASGLPLDILSNGFKIRTSDVGVNTNTATYIYMAFASNPYKYSLGA
jgi:hypothetical protein